MDNSFQSLNKSAKTFAASAAVILVLQVAPNVLMAQKSDNTTQTHLAHKLAFLGKFATNPMKAQIVGVDKGAAVYKNDRGEFFTLDPRTGDLHFISASDFAAYKLFYKNAIKVGDKSLLSSHKYPSAEAITIVGFDREGHSIQQNSRGDTYYVHPTTGDFVFVKS